MLEVVRREELSKGWIGLLIPKLCYHLDSARPLNCHELLNCVIVKWELDRVLRKMESCSSGRGENLAECGVHGALHQVHCGPSPGKSTVITR